MWSLWPHCYIVQMQDYEKGILHILVIIAQIMASRLFGANPFSKPMLGCQ